MELLDIAMRYCTKILLLLVAMGLWGSCDKAEGPEPFHYDREVLVIFPPEGIEAHSFSGLLYQGLYEATTKERVLFRPLLPMTYDEGLRRISQAASFESKGIKRLVVVADPTYAEDMVEQQIADQVLNTESVKMIILGVRFDHPNIYNAHIPPYGLMYKAGYISGKMADVERATLFVASAGSAYYREAIDGFTQGYERAGKRSLTIDDMSMEYLDNRVGYNLRQEAYSLYSPRYDRSSDLVLPLCRESAMGFYRYNREYPGSFYTLGVDNDMSIYAEDVPFSCISLWREVAEKVVSDWNNGRLDHARKYGLEEAYTAIVAAEKHKHIVQPLSDEIHDEAIQKEREYLR